MAKNTKKRGLGRGLSALMSDVQEGEKTEPGNVKVPDQHVPIEKVRPNPDQPRRTFEKSALEDLAASVAEKGIIQPLIVRPANNGEYEIVAGERRWRAAQMASLHDIPVIIREFDDVEVLEIAIIENIQRADLNPLEEALGFSQLMEKFGHTQELLSKALGKSRSYIANAVRLLGLPDEIKDFVKDGKLSAGHARALLTAGNPVELARKAVKSGLSVREVERLAKQGSPETVSKKTGASAAAAKDADTVALEGDLSANLGMKVAINHATGGEKGQVVISYASLDDLDELCRILTSTR